VLTPGQPSPGLSYPPASPHRSPTASSGPTLPARAPPKRGHPRLGWLASLGSALARAGGYGIINPLSIDYASRPRLRSRLTLGGLACPRNPWSSGGRVSHPACATHACILTRVTSTPGSRRSFHGDTALPYPPPPLNPHPAGNRLEPRSITRGGAAVSAVCLSPATLSARNHLTSELLRTLSRMAASKPTSWLSVRLHILSH
jgi:hypothetical protein